MTKVFTFNRDQLQDLYRYAYALSLHADDAYDVLQTAIEKYLNNQKKSPDVIAPLAMMRTLIRNVYIDSYRYKQRWQSEPYEEMSRYDISPISLENCIISKDLADKLWQSLLPKDRDLLYHWVILGHSTDEVCALCDISRGSFLSRMHRLRKKCNEDNAITLSSADKNKGIL